jgi:hypothetical protein
MGGGAPSAPQAPPLKPIPPANPAAMTPCISDAPIFFASRVAQLTRDVGESWWSLEKTVSISLRTAGAYLAVRLKQPMGPLLQKTLESPATQFSPACSNAIFRGSSFHFWLGRGRLLGAFARLVWPLFQLADPDQEAGTPVLRQPAPHPIAYRTGSPCWRSRPPGA